MTPFKVEADPRIMENVGKIAVQRGPIIYCAEAVDNPDVNLPDFRAVGEIDTLEGQTFAGLPMLQLHGKSRKEGTRSGAYHKTGIFARVSDTVRLIPYHAFANRGKSDMQVWFLD